MILNKVKLTAVLLFLGLFALISHGCIVVLVVGEACVAAAAAAAAAAVVAPP